MTPQDYLEICLLTSASLTAFLLPCSAYLNFKDGNTVLAFIFGGVALAIIGALAYGVWLFA